MTTTTPTARRTAKTMDDRRTQAVKVLEKLLADAEAKAERATYLPSQAYERGAAAGLQQALKTLEWAFSSEQDWMYR